MDDEIGTHGTPDDQMPVWVRRLIGQAVYVVVALVVVVGGFFVIKGMGDDAQAKADKQVECGVYGRNC